MFVGAREGVMIWHNGVLCGVSGFVVAICGRNVRVFE